MLKLSIGLVTFLFVRAATAQTPNPATDITASDIQRFLKALPRGQVSDLPIRVVDVGGYRIGIYGVYRPHNSVQEAVLHETTVTEVYQILDGSGTLVTGGTLVDTWREPKTSNTVRAKRIDGGVSRHVGKGDVIIIPGRLPHWFSSLDSDLTYLITRPDPEGKLPLK